MVAAILLPTWIDKLGFSGKLVTVKELSFAISSSNDEV